MFNFNPTKNAFDKDGKPKPALTKALDTVLRVQRPLVLSMVKKVREKHPDETPAQIVKRLEQQFLRDVTVGGGAIGASAFIPGIGTVTSVGLSALAVGGYLERTALFAQAIAEINGVDNLSEQETRTLVMGIMLGEDGASLMNSLLAQSGKASGLTSKWGLMMGKNDSGKIFSVERTIRNMFVKRFITRQSGALLGRALPFGIGAVVGGGANLALGRQVIKSTHEAFGEAPATFPDYLSVKERAPKFKDDEKKSKSKNDETIEGELAE